MRVAQLFGATLKETPADAELVSHQLLLRAGYVRPLGAGIFSALPLAWRALRRIEAILRDEMDAIGGQELSLPVVHPAAIWQASGRWSSIGPEMVRLQDRRGADLALAMTHEEVVAWHARTEVGSWRQLPQVVYQIQTKFRDEPRARGGLIRVREFTMKDSYSLDADEAGLQASYDAHHEAYLRIFARCGLPVLAVDSDAGMMGGATAREYMFVSPIGEDHLVTCAGCGYAANREVAAFSVPLAEGEGQPVEPVETPGARTIAELAAFLGIEAADTAKVVLYEAEGSEGPPLLMVLVRGDMEANDIAVARAAGATAVAPARPEALEGTGIVPGYASPIGIDRTKVRVLVDPAVAGSAALVAGGNAVDLHLRHTRCGRDYRPDRVAPLALAPEGARCSRCDGPLEQVRGVEVGNIFQLGTRYSEAVGATFLDASGRERPLVMGSYGIGVGRLLACLAEAHHDDHGLRWPPAVAPFQVALVAMARKAPAREAAESLYAALRAAGIEVLFDDRPKLSPGAKLAEADLRGLPLRVVVSDRGVADGLCELKARAGDAAVTVPLDEAVDAVRATLGAWARDEAPVEVVTLPPAP